MSESRANVPTQHHFADMAQQREAVSAGMWTFLVTEIMFFGGLFTAYTIYWFQYPQAFAIGAQHGNFWLGSLNTGVLLVSSFFMALAVHAAREGRSKILVRHLIVPMILGAAFLAIKGVEYTQHIHEGVLPGPYFRLEGPDARQVELFFFLYFVMTSLHAVHMIAGIAVLFVLAIMARQHRFSANYNTPIEAAGLYWHFVDIVWVFLYPMFYLLGGH